LAGLHDEVIKVRIASRPVEGAANAALLDFMAELFDVPRREVRMLRGEKSRRKAIFLPLPPERVAQVFGKLLNQESSGMLGEHS